MRRILATLIVASVIVTAPFAQEVVSDRFPNALGAHTVIDFASSNSLGGLSYQRWLGPLGLQAIVGATIDVDNVYWYNVAGSLQYRLYAADFAEWFSGGLYLNGILGHSGRGGGLENTAYAPAFQLGLGVGIETIFLEHLAPSLEFMYLGSYQPSLTNPVRLGFALGLSMRYRF